MQKRDREGRVIKVGDSVAMAISINRNMHFENYIVRICKKREGRLILDGTMNWGWLEDYDEKELQVLHKDVNLIQMSNYFESLFPDNRDFNRRTIHTQDAHHFYNDVVERLIRRTSEYLEIKDHRQAKTILLSMLDLSQGAEADTAKSIDEMAVKAACMQQIIQEAITKINDIQKKH
jgi:hypothetical protein